MKTHAAKKAGRPRNKATDVLRAYAEQAGRFTRKSARESLGITERSLDTAISTLLLAGRIERKAKATYEWVTGDRRPKREAPVEERIWHAMRINPTWSVADIAQQAGSSVGYVLKRLRHYRAEGYVKRCGARQVWPAGRIRLFRLTVQAARMVEAPRIEEHKTDPLVLAAVSLNKLVCTGLVRFPDERRRAVELCSRILSGLGEKS